MDEEQEGPRRMDSDVHQPWHQQGTEGGHQDKEEQGNTTADAENLGQEMSVFGCAIPRSRNAVRLMRVGKRPVV